MNFDYPILEEAFKKLPTEIQEALSSVEISRSVMSIADKYGLLLDQADTLSDVITYTMLGLIKSGDFKQNLSKELRLDKNKLDGIEKEVNEKVFSQTRSFLQNNSFDEIETAGNFTIEKELEQAAPPTDGVINKDRVLNEIENPTLHNANPINIIDHMLSGPTESPATKENVVATPPPTPVKKYSADPYREPLA